MTDKRPALTEHQRALVGIGVTLGLAIGAGVCGEATDLTQKQLARMLDGMGGKSRLVDLIVQHAEHDIVHGSMDDEARFATFVHQLMQAWRAQQAKDPST